MNQSKFVEEKAVDKKEGDDDFRKIFRLFYRFLFNDVGKNGGGGYSSLFPFHKLQVKANLIMASFRVSASRQQFSLRNTFHHRASKS